MDPHKTYSKETNGFPATLAEKHCSRVYIVQSVSTIWVNFIKFGCYNNTYKTLIITTQGYLSFPLGLV